MRFTRGFQLAFLAILFLAKGFNAPLAGADQGGYSIEDYQVRVDLKKNSVLEVHESIIVDFSQPRHGIYRDIPYQYKNVRSGVRAARPWNTTGQYEVSIFDIRVTNRQFSVSKENAEIRIRIGSPKHFVYGRQVYDIFYRVYGAINRFQEHQELYWNLVGNAWGTPVKHASFVVSFPVAVEWNPDDVFVMSGAFGSRYSADVSFSVDPQQIIGQTTPGAALRPHEGLTIGARFPLTVVSDGGFAFKALLWAENNWILGFPFGAFILGFLLWFFLGRERPLIVPVAYEPPKSVHPCECGVLIDDGLDDEDLTALIYYWAAEGYIKIIEEAAGYTLVQLKPLRDSPKPYEMTLWLKLFEKSKSVSLDELRGTVGTTFQMAKSQLDDEIGRINYYTQASRAASKGLKATWWLWLVLGFFVMKTPALPVVNWVWFALSAFIWHRFGVWMPKKSRGGTEVYRQLLGFKRFIKRVEINRLTTFLRQDPNYFDKTLPYAIVLGLGREWADKFSALSAAPPSWYVSNDGNPMGFRGLSRSLSESHRRMNSVLTSVPPSTGGGSGLSGFGGSGGGFSGGGFGGGGGGSW